MHRAILIACSVVVALVCIANCANSSPPNRFSDDPILSVVIDGKKFEIPRYKQKEVRLSQQRYEYEQSVADSMKEMMTKLAKRALIKGRGSVMLFFSVEKVLTEMEVMDDTNEQLIRFSKPYPLQTGFGDINSQMIKRMIKKSPGESVETLTKEEAYRRFELVMDAIAKLTAMSNTGLNLDWTKLKIDGKSVEQYLKPSTLLLAKRSGLNNILKTVANYLEDSKNVGKKSKTKQDVGDFEDEYDMA